MAMLDFMPEQASEWAPRVDLINNVITWASVFFTVAICGAMLYFAYRYRRKPDYDPADPKTPNITHNSALETVWTVVPSIICMFLFYYGFAVYHDMRTPPSNAIEINVDAQKYSWSFTYPNGRKATTDLVVPLGKPVRLIMTSHDTLHSFFVPSMRVKEDVVPNVYSYLWFTPTMLGQFHLFCTEYCGVGHSTMRGSVKVVSAEAFQDFLLDRKAADAPQLTPAQQGEQLFQSKACVGCHSIDGTARVGPSFKGIFARGKEPIFQQEEVTVDENYIRESILNPSAKLVAGFEKTAPMPSFQGQLSEDELKALIAYLKSL